jgi:hypothetical protein
MITEVQAARIIALLETIALNTDAGRVRPSAPASNGGAVFPNYGKSKGQPIAGASERDLAYYRNGALRSIADPAKTRWREKEQTLLAAIEAEMARQGFSYEEEATGPRSSSGPAPDFSPDPDDDVPFVHCGGVR